MQGLDLLRDLTVIFGVSVGVVLLLHRIRLPAITGFLVSGVLLGPHGLSLVSDVGRLELLADAGVMLLLFTVGVEFSLATLRRLWGTVVAGALLPVALTSGLLLAAAPAAGLTRGQGVFLGFLLSLSSTVIPLRVLSDRGQVDSPHGRAAVGVAVLQDLAVIPMMLMTPFLARAGGVESPETGWTALMGPALALTQAAVVVAAVVWVARWGVPRLLRALAALRSREVFVISVLLTCVGTAWITSLLGLSIALGAFLAGLVISESEFGHQALADVLPFRDSLNSLFFVSIGMLMDPGLVIERPLTVLSMAAAIAAVKVLLIGGALLATGRRPSTALQAGLVLSQVGEFSFVLMRFGSSYDLLTDQTSQIFLGASVLTMAATPLIVAASRPLVDTARRWEDSSAWRQAEDRRASASIPEDLSDHVVIVGYGFNGRNLARVLGEIGIPYVVLEINPRTVREARAEGERIAFGDAASPAMLSRLAAGRARVLVLAISDPVSTRRAVAVARAGSPALHIVVRTRYLVEVDELYRLGADAVVPEEVETSMEIFARVLEPYGVPREALVKHARRIRAERYGLFRAGRAAGAQGLGELKPYLASAEVQVCAIPAGSAADGRSLRDLDLRGATGATVLALLRDGSVCPNPAPDLSLRAGDSVVLLGEPEQVGAAMETLARADS